MKSLSISIPKPCHEKWNTFTLSEKGGHCARCDKHVIDFTKMSDDQIARFFQSNPSHACGRFLPSQLKLYAGSVDRQTLSGNKFLKAGVLLTLLTLAEGTANAQEPKAIDMTETIQSEAPAPSKEAPQEKIRISGVVKVDEGEIVPLPGASVWLKGTRLGAATDATGAFSLITPLRPDDVLMVAFIGFRTKEIPVGQLNVAHLEIILDIDDVELMGEVVIGGVYQVGVSQETKPSLWKKIKSLF